MKILTLLTSFCAALILGSGCTSTQSALKPTALKLTLQCDGRPLLQGVDLEESAQDLVIPLNEPIRDELRCHVEIYRAQ